MSSGTRTDSPWTVAPPQRAAAAQAPAGTSTGSIPRPHLLSAATANAGAAAQTGAALPGAAQLEACDLTKAYHKAKVRIPVLQGVSLRVERGEFVSIMGQSGSGKSTLMHLLATLDEPDTGEVRFAGQRVDNLPPRERDRLRNFRLGMIFQFYHLLPELTALENVLAPAMIAHGAWGYWRRRREHRSEALRLLDMVGLGHRLRHRPREMSGGEMQRAAIARALIMRPEALLADEPTGNLDQATGADILRLLRNLNEQEKLTIVMVSHDRGIADQADRIVRLANGQLADE